MHDDQVRIDETIARRLVDDNFPEFRSEPVELIDSQGTVNAIFRVGTTMAARFPLRSNDPEGLRAELERNAAAMHEFERWSPFPTPRPFGIGEAGHSFPMPWTMQSWLEGDVATPNGFSASDTFAGDLTALIESLRGAETAGREFSGHGRGGLIADHDGWMQTCFRESAALLDVPKLRSLWERFRDLPRAEADVMSHKDLIPANILIRSQHIVGILDAGDFGPADPALDLVAAWHLLDHERRELLRARLGSGDDEWARGAAWAFQQAMGLVWYYERTNPRMSELGRSTLQRLIDDRDSATGSS